MLVLSLMRSWTANLWRKRQLLGSISICTNLKNILWVKRLTKKLYQFTPKLLCTSSVSSFWQNLCAWYWWNLAEGYYSEIWLTLQFSKIPLQNSSNFKYDSINTVSTSNNGKIQVEKQWTTTSLVTFFHDIFFLYFISCKGQGLNSSYLGRIFFFLSVNQSRRTWSI